MRNPRIGLLPFYLELIDKAMPEERKWFEKFYKQIANELRDRNIEVCTSKLCQIKKEFDETVKLFEKKSVDAIVTLHLLYSPSLESVEALASTPLPIIICDTTECYDFGPSQNPEQILYNHGIHGVQDMCNLLNRKGKNFVIETGHWEKSDVLDRVAADAKAAAIVTSIRSMRVGLIDKPFIGMGDFFVPYDDLKKLIGIEVIKIEPRKIKKLLPTALHPEVKAEILYDCKHFKTDNLNHETHINSVISGLAIRRWIKENDLAAFSINFMDVNRKRGLPTMPFIEASKAMGRGIGYAGEGDVLTASLVGALASQYEETTFTEMFCPNWKSGSIFMSHMGEANINLFANKPQLIEKPFPWVDAYPPLTAVGLLKPGKAYLINLAPCPDNKFSLILMPGEMLKVKEKNRMEQTVHGWFMPHSKLADCLEQYSVEGGTHHSALVYTNAIKPFVCFGKMMGWKVVVIS